jgi:hypothetical protein
LRQSEKIPDAEFEISFTSPSLPSAHLHVTVIKRIFSFFYHQHRSVRKLYTHVISACSSFNEDPLSKLNLRRIIVFLAFPLL